MTVDVGPMTPMYEQADSAASHPTVVRRQRQREATHWSAAAWRFMYQALEIARSAQGLSWPNPPVGCLIVRDGQIISMAGSNTVSGLTAEGAALAAAAPNPGYAEAYLTMEPICPEEEQAFAELFLRSGMSRIYIATEDPHPDNAGRTIAALRAAGLSVHTGYCQHDAEAILRPYRKWVTTGRPFVTSVSANVFDRLREVDLRPFDAVAHRGEASAIDLGIGAGVVDDATSDSQSDRSGRSTSIKIAPSSLAMFLKAVGMAGIHNLAVKNSDDLGIELARCGHVDAFL